jgi:hypothetical protein
MATPLQLSSTYRPRSVRNLPGTLIVAALYLVAGPASAAPIVFPVTQPTTSGPAFPSVSPITIALGTGGGTHIGTLALDIQSVTGNAATRIDANNGLLDMPVAAFANVFQPSDPCQPGDPCRQTFDLRFDTLTGTVVAPPSPIRSGDGTTFDGSANLAYSLIPGDPCTPGDPCRVNIHGATLQPIQFLSVVDPPSSSFFDLLITTQFTGPIDFTNPLFELTVTGQTSTVPEPTTLLLCGSGLVAVARRFRRRGSQSAS